MKILLQYLKPYRPLVLLAFILAGINQTFSLFDPMIFGKLIDEFAKTPWWINQVPLEANHNLCGG